MPQDCSSGTLPTEGVNSPSPLHSPGSAQHWGFVSSTAAKEASTQLEHQQMLLPLPIRLARQEPVAPQAGASGQGQVPTVTLMDYAQKNALIADIAAGKYTPLQLLRIRNQLLMQHHQIMLQHLHSDQKPPVDHQFQSLMMQTHPINFNRQDQQWTQHQQAMQQPHMMHQQQMLTKAMDTKLEQEKIGVNGGFATRDHKLPEPSDHQAQLQASNVAHRSEMAAQPSSSE